MPQSCLPIQQVVGTKSSPAVAAAGCWAAATSVFGPPSRKDASAEAPPAAALPLRNVRRVIAIARSLL